MGRKNAFYAQSGGVSAVINASACGVIETARENAGTIGKVLAGRNGIIGALTEDLVDTSRESESAVAALRYTPSGAFGQPVDRYRCCAESAFQNRSAAVLSSPCVSIAACVAQRLARRPAISGRQPGPLPWP